VCVCVCDTDERTTGPCRAGCLCPPPQPSPPSVTSLLQAMSAVPTVHQRSTVGRLRFLGTGKSVNGVNG
jgi:hypothetical protein